MPFMQSILFISELYYPEETSTGFFVTGIAEGLAQSDELHVSALCAQPTYSKKGVSAAKREVHHGVSIRRLSAPAGDKNKLFGRLWNIFSLTLKFSFSMIRQIKRGDVVVVLTNPPSLPLLAGWICRLKGAKPVLLVHDVYPDVLVPTGFAKESSLLYRIFDRVQKHMLRMMTQVIVLGRDMQHRLRAKLPASAADKFSIIPNWGDELAIHPALRSENALRRKLGLESKFVVQFSGNLGRTHGLEDLVALAKKLKDNPKVHFLVFGWGAGRDWLKQTIEDEELTNITLLDPCAKDELGTYLTACDLFLLPFKKGMEGISVPSRLYNVMAAGSPILAVAGAPSELALVVEEESMGWVVEPGNVDAMAKVVLEAAENPESLESMSRNARAAMEAKYTKEAVVNQFAELIKKI